MKTYRIGIIGLGRMGSTIDDEGHTPLPYSIAAACQASNQLEIVSGCDLLPDRRAQFEKRWDVHALYEDFTEMVQNEELDIVAVCTTASGLQKPAQKAPNSSFRGDSHAELAIALSTMGVPMLYIEKAMASSMIAADKVKSTVLKNKTVFNTGVLRRFDNRYKIVRNAVLRGDIGEPKMVIHCAPTTLMHGHIHSIDTISWLIGDPPIAAVRGELIPRDYVITKQHIPYDPPATFELQFENGIRALSVPVGCWDFEIIGSRGSIRTLNNGNNVSFRKALDSEKSSKIWHESAIEPAIPHSTVRECLENLIYAYENGKKSRGNIEVTHHITEACIAVAESHQCGGRWVNLPLTERDLYIWHI
tara:strand:+ start:75007 stop:76089 length:1083 start_codon:yes stop_codon:yes gene_type:complete